jgi:hypothetical protein
VSRLTENRNGVKTFVIGLNAINPVEEVFFKSNRDSGIQYTASMTENVYRLDRIHPGNTLMITIVNKGFKSVTQIIPRKEDRICYAGHYLPGSALVSQDAKTGDYIKLATLGGEMYHVIESSGKWAKEWLDGNDID